MLLSMQSDYALRVLLDIASSQETRGIITRVIAERQHVPRVFLTKIIAQLATNGFLRTQRGKGGGVSLGREPSEINILEVVEVFEGQLHSNSCTIADEFCDFSNNCAIRQLWFNLEGTMREHLGKMTLVDLMELSPSQKTTHKEAKVQE
jgi:Rrf2 family protein